MKKYICALASVALLVACEQKTTVTNPPAEKSETDTTVVKESESQDSAAKAETEASTSKTINETSTIAASPSP